MSTCGEESDVDSDTDCGEIDQDEMEMMMMSELDDSCENYDDYDEEDELGELFTEDEDDDDDDEEATNEQHLNRLKTIQGDFKYAGRRERCKLLEQLRYLFKNWKGTYPDLRAIFPREEMDWLLSEVVKFSCHSGERADFIDFVCGAGYVDQPKLNNKGKPVLRRSTPLHQAAKDGRSLTVRKLFGVYDRFDLNYADGSGLTHFHAACITENCADAVRKFLDAGQNPNCVWRETGDTPLHLALEHYNTPAAELLLRNGANPNLANKNGFTPLHVVCRGYRDTNMTTLFELSHCELRVDARDTSGNTPLHLALGYRNQNVTELLLMNGADPDVANADGYTALHVLCRSKRDYGFASLFFQMCEKNERTLQIDAMDHLGRTPLQWAVVSLLPDVVGVLADRGADLSSFVFPTESHFEEHLKTFELSEYDLKVELTRGLLMIVECLEARRYELDRDDALVVMKLLDNHRVFEKSTKLHGFWYNDTEFANAAKMRAVNSRLTLYDAMRLRPKSVPFADLARFARKESFYHISEKYREASIERVCDALARGFCRKWALEFFATLTRYRLPIDCCEMILEPLANKDLWRVCLASRGSKKIYNSRENQRVHKKMKIR